MFCTKCGTEIPENAAFCPTCAAPANEQSQDQPTWTQQNVTSPQPPVKVTDWLIPSILSTIFCCVPLGAVSIVFAAQANSMAAQGQFESAQKAADKAKLFLLLGVGLWALAIVIYLLFYIFFICIAVLSSN